jgi:hypothetical protein
MPRPDDIGGVGSYRAAHLQSSSDHRPHSVIEQQADDETSRAIGSIKPAIKHGCDRTGDDFDAGEDSAVGEAHSEEMIVNPSSAEGKAK